jgi:crossover junction endodeoxyribonuclease RuvC
VPSPPDALRILGLDPGTRVVGWAVLETRGSAARALGHGTLRAAAAWPTARRLATLAAGLREVLARFRPHEAAIEAAFYGKDARAAQRIGEGRGALLLVLAEAGLPVRDYANNVVKQAVTGAGRAAKEQVQAMVCRVLGLDRAPSELDASDALAVALCHHHRRGLPDGAAGLPPRVREALERAGIRPPRARRAR